MTTRTMPQHARSPKTQSSYRLSPQAVQLISELAEHWGLSLSGTVELCIRMAVPEEIGEPRVLKRIEADRSAVSPLPSYPYWVSIFAKDRLSELQAIKGMDSKAVVLECIVRHRYEEVGLGAAA